MTYSQLRAFHCVATYGGFSKVYGGAIHYPQTNDLSTWPKASIPDVIDYRLVLDNLPIQVYSFQNDEVNCSFPLFPIPNLLFETSSTKKSFLGSARIASSKSSDQKNSDKDKANPYDVSSQFTIWRTQSKISYKRVRVSKLIPIAGNH